jgi:hypothetical protein
MEPSRQSTSDSDAYARGNGPLDQASKNNVAEGGGEEDLAELVAGLEELVEEPEFDDEEPKWDAKGKMKMPEPQHFGTRLSTTQEEDEDIYGDEGEQTMRMPEPFTHSRDQSSSTQRTLYAQISSGEPTFSTNDSQKSIASYYSTYSHITTSCSLVHQRREASTNLETLHPQGMESRVVPPSQNLMKIGVSHPLRAGPLQYPRKRRRDCTLEGTTPQ